jgi:hypothetical protein
LLLDGRRDDVDRGFQTYGADDPVHRRGAPRSASPARAASARGAPDQVNIAKEA